VHVGDEYRPEAPGLYLLEAQGLKRAMGDGGENSGALLQVSEGLLSFA
jgi:hypothetical protein